MVDVGSVASVISSLKTAADLTKGFLDLKEAAAVQGKVIELQGIILAAQTSALAAQSEQFVLQQQAHELQAKMAKLEAWESEKSRYQLVDFGSGTFAYNLRPEQANGDPSHKICVNCFNSGHKSVLQFSHRGADKRDYFKCERCKNDIPLGTAVEWSPQQISRNDYF